MQFLRVRIQNAASDRSIPPKLPIFTGQPKWHCYRSILNAKTKNEFVFRFSYFIFENEKRKRNSLSVFRSQIWKRKRKKRYIHGPRKLNWWLAQHFKFAEMVVNTICTSKCWAVNSISHCWVARHVLASVRSSRWMWTRFGRFEDSPKPSSIIFLT